MGEKKLVHLAASLLDLVDLVILSLDAEVGGINLLPQIVLGALKTGGLVNDILDSGASGVEGEHQLVLLCGQLAVDLGHGGAVSHGLVDVGLGDGNLLLVLLLELCLAPEKPV